jgi:hypothetical protein
MLRRMGMFVRVIAITLLALLAAVWIRSEFRSDWIVFARHAGSEDITFVECGWSRGRCYLDECTGVFAAMHTRSGSCDLDPGNGWSMTRFEWDRDRFQALGIEVWKSPGSYLIYVPLWVPAAVFASLLVWPHRRARRRRRFDFRFPVKLRD